MALSMPLSCYLLINLYPFLDKRRSNLVHWSDAQMSASRRRWWWLSRSVGHCHDDHHEAGSSHATSNGSTPRTGRRRRRMRQAFRFVPQRARCYLRKFLSMHLGTTCAPALSVRTCLSSRPWRLRLELPIRLYSRTAIIYIFSKLSLKTTTTSLINFTENHFTHPIIVLHFHSFPYMHCIHPINRNTVVLLRVHQTNKPPITFGFNQEYIRYWFFPSY